MTDPSNSADDPRFPSRADETESLPPEVPAVPGLYFVTHDVTPTEAAAVSAVLHGLVREESDHLRQAPVHGQSAWQRSQRAVRVPLTPGDGRWRGFSV